MAIASTAIPLLRVQQVTYFAADSAEAKAVSHSFTCAPARSYTRWG